MCTLRMRSCVVGVNDMGLGLGLVVAVKWSAWDCNVLERYSELVMMRRDACAALVTRVEFLYASGIALSICLAEAGETPIALDPSSGRVMTTGSV